jgi:hypothetical protein
LVHLCCFGGAVTRLLEPSRVQTYESPWMAAAQTYGYPFSTVVPDETFSQYKSVTFSPVFLRGYVVQVVPNINGCPAMHLDMLRPRGLSGAPSRAPSRPDRTLRNLLA